MLRSMFFIFLFLPLVAALIPEYNVKVTFEGATTTIKVKSDETILQALERSNVSRTLSLDLPSDCRRGNCMTCSARHMDGSQKDRLAAEDGLAPSIGDEVRRRGYVLTCSSFVRGEGVHLDLAKNTDAWTEMYRTRLEEEETRSIARAAMAKTIRKYAEERLDEYIEETEETYRKSGI